jgi:hypothetical protein
MAAAAALKSVTDIWIIWACCLATMVVFVYRSVARYGWPNLRHFLDDERGASYALPYVLTFPVVMLIFCLIVQTTLILLVKMGTMYAAYASARAAIVWRSSDPEDEAKGAEAARFYAGRAAALAMTPFSSGYDEHLEQIYPGVALRAIQNNRLPVAGLSTVALDQLLDVYTGMYTRMGSDATEPAGHSGIIDQPNRLANREYVQNKLLFAALATDVEFSSDIKPWNEDVEVKVKYLMPLHIPGVARILANQTGGPLFNPQYFAREITTTVKLPSEAPKTDNHLLGIPYYPALTSRYSLDELFN